MIPNGLKRTITASGELGLLQMVLESRHWAVCQQGRWTPKEVDCEIPHRLERGTKHSL